MLYLDDPDARRLRLRSWRRGTREMDLILGPFADTQLGDMDAEARAIYAALLEENDNALYDWMSGRELPPERHKGLVDRIRAFHGIAV